MYSEIRHNPCLGAKETSATSNSASERRRGEAEHQGEYRHSSARELSRRLSERGARPMARGLRLRAPSALSAHRKAARASREARGMVPARRGSSAPRRRSIASSFFCSALRVYQLRAPSLLALPRARNIIDVARIVHLLPARSNIIGECPSANIGSNAALLARAARFVIHQTLRTINPPVNPATWHGQISGASSWLPHRPVCHRLERLLSIALMRVAPSMASGIGEKPMMPTLLPAIIRRNSLSTSRGRREEAMCQERRRPP